MVLPAGTILDAATDKLGDRVGWKFQNVALTWPPPVNAMALDQDGYDEMLRHHPYWQIQTPGFGDGIIRHGDPQPKEKT
jgi:hypothetical protein